MRLSEKDGKITNFPCHHNFEAWFREYMEAGGLLQAPDTPLFRAVDRSGSVVRLSERRLNLRHALEAVSRRAEQAHEAGVISTWALCAHSFRAIGITACLEHPDARVEVAQYLAGHAKTDTTRLCDRRAELISLWTRSRGSASEPDFRHSRTLWVPLRWVNHDFLPRTGRKVPD